MRRKFASPRAERAELAVREPFPEFPFCNQWEKLVAEILDVESSQNPD
jgi:hypothetical protein